MNIFFASLALLGEADLLAGQIISPRSPPDCLANFSELTFIPDDEWIVRGVCAYVPQTAWLQNASIRENILFNLPYNEKRYTATLEVSKRRPCETMVLPADCGLFPRIGMCPSYRLPDSRGWRRSGDRRTRC